MREWRYISTILNLGLISETGHKPNLIIKLVVDNLNRNIDTKVATKPITVMP
jgi:hypothetical protein